MSFQIVLANATVYVLNVSVSGTVYTLQPSSSQNVAVPSTGAVATVSGIGFNQNLAVSYTSNLLGQQPTNVALGFGGTFPIASAGSYVIYLAQDLGLVSGSALINAILASGNNGYYYGNNQQVYYVLQQLQQESGQSLASILNQPVLTFIPGQGRTEVTPLEAAIISRDPQLVLQLIRLGANPLETTAGVPLITQLQEAPDAGSPVVQEIIQILYASGAYRYPYSYYGPRRRRNCGGGVVPLFEEY